MVILDDNPTPEAITLLLNLTGRFGAITGYPGHRLEIQSVSDDNSNYDDKDIMIITAANTAVSDIDENAPTSKLLKNNHRIIKQAFYNGAYDADTTEDVQVSLVSSGLSRYCRVSIAI
nr:cellulose biosynthesis cyclic di-GMP-binding regulatory protein BcsB [Pseudoalteromonas sp. WY3]